MKTLNHLISLWAMLVGIQGISYVRCVFLYSLYIYDMGKDCFLSTSHDIHPRKFESLGHCAKNRRVYVGSKESPVTMQKR